jgi:hypothetical protein
LSSLRSAVSPVANLLANLAPFIFTNSQLCKLKTVTGKAATKNLQIRVDNADGIRRKKSEGKVFGISINFEEPIPWLGL